MAAFFKEHNYLVGISIDGPQELHDAYRVNKRNEGSFDDVLRGWHCLRKHEVDVNIFCPIHAANADHPLEVYRFFRNALQAQYIQLIPIVERATPETLAAANQGWGGPKGTHRPLYTQSGNLVTERTVGAEQFGKFLISIFDEWVSRYVGKMFVTTFDVALGSWMGQHNACIVSLTCGRSVVLEHTGDVYSCDHFVEPAHLLCDLQRSMLKCLVASEKEHRFGEAKYYTLPQYCRQCPVPFACNGECPRNRFIKTPTGEDGLGYQTPLPLDLTRAGSIRSSRMAGAERWRSSFGCPTSSGRRSNR